MTKEEAQQLAYEINQHRDWLAHAEIVNIHERPQRWWVQAHHPAMPHSPMRPFPTLPISNREEWEEARKKWK